MKPTAIFTIFLLLIEAANAWINYKVHQQKKSRMTFQAVDTSILVANNYNLAAGSAVGIRKRKCCIVSSSYLRFDYVV